MMRASVLIGLIVLTIPRSHGQSKAADSPQFEVASIKLNTLDPDSDNNPEAIDTSPGGRLTMRNVRLTSCLKWAYGVQEPQISGPGWINSERYDIIAQAPEPSAADQLKLMLRALLADRFKLVLHRETKELTVYGLVVAKNGPKFHASEGEGKRNLRRTQTGVVAEKISMPEFAEILAGQLRGPVADMTGLNGRFDLAFDLRQFVPNESTPVSITSLILEAMQDQLGLKLQSRKAAAEVMVIDHVEKPSAN